MNVNTMPVAGWLLHTAVGGGLLLLLTWGLMARTRQPALRQRLGEWGLASALAVAILSMGPSWLLISWGEGQHPKAEGPPTEARPTPLFFQLPPGELPAEQSEMALPPVDDTESAEEVAESEGPRRSGEALEMLGLVAVLVYAVGAGLLLGRWGLGHVALARLLRGAVPAPAAVAQLFGQAGGRSRPARLLVSNRVRVPVSCGLLRPTVVLPAGLCVTPDPARLRWAFLHELTHLDRRDAWSCLLFGLGQAVFFYLPWFWPVRRQVRLCQEYVADAAAAGQGCVADYAEFLLSLTGAPAVPLGATGVSGHYSDLFRRVTMLLQDPLRVETRCPRRRLLAAAGALLALAVVVAGVGVRAEGPTIIIITGDSAPKVVHVADPSAAGRVPVSGPDAKKADSGNRVTVPADGPAAIWIDIDNGFPVAKPVTPLGSNVTVLNETFAALASGPQPQDSRHFTLKLRADALKKAVEQLRQNPDKAELEQIRKELEKVIEQLAAQHLPPHPKAIRSLTFSPDGRQLFWIIDSGPHLGLSVEKPSAVLGEQLGLAAGQGLVIKEVHKDSAAEKAGLKVNDILLEVNGKPVPSEPADFLKQSEGLKPGAVVAAVILRKGKREEVKGLVVPQSSGPGQVRLWQLEAALPQPPKTPPPPAKGAVTTTRTRTVEQFTTRFQEGKLKITVIGAVEDGKKTRVFEIAIQEGDGPLTKYNGVEQVPAQYRDRVRQLIDTSGQGQERSQVRPLFAPIEVELRPR